MTEHKKPLHIVAQSKPLLFSLLVVMLSMMAFETIEFSAQYSHRIGGGFTDFDIFYLVSKLVHEGRLDEAYHFKLLAPIMLNESGEESFMPWTYPPYANVPIMAFAQVSKGVAYATWIVSTFAAFVLAVRRLDREFLPGVLFLIGPVLTINIRCGQNGFLIGALASIFCVLYLRQSKWSGVALGLLAIKPHLAAGLIIFLFFERRWKELSIAASTIFCMAACATMLFGVSIWLDFYNAVGEARIFLREGLYPLFRMTSIYAWLYSSTGSAGLATSAQGLLAVLSLGCLWFVSRSTYSPRTKLTIALMGTLMLSPYAYDYDMSLLGVAIALSARELVWRCSGAMGIMMWVSAWLATGAGLAGSIYRMFVASNHEVSGVDHIFSAGFIGILLMGFSCFAIFYHHRMSKIGSCM